MFRRMMRMMKNGKMLMMMMMTMMIWVEVIHCQACCHSWLVMVSVHRKRFIHWTNCATF